MDRRNATWFAGHSFLRLALISFLAAVQAVVFVSALPATARSTSLAFSKLTVAAGNYPRSAAVADLNGDGILDMAVANFGSNTVSVMLGKGDGTFGPKSDLATGANPFWVSIGDVNGDGKPDLVVANNGSGDVSVLLGTGDGTFAPHVEFVAGSAVQSVAIGDLNRDGKPDLVVACAGTSSVAVLLGNGDGTFRAPSNYGAGLNPRQAVIGDLNNDGIPDVAVANVSSNDLSLLIGNGDGTFKPTTSINLLANNPYSVAIGDLNGDGRSDLAVAMVGDPAVLVLNGLGGGSFSLPSKYTVGTPQLSVAIGDVNNDGTPDLVVAGAVPGKVSVLFGNGAGSFLAANQTLTQGYLESVALGDLNRDGRLDVVVANSSGNNVFTLLQATPTTLALTSNPNPSVFGGTVALVATAVVGATGTVHFYDGDVLLGDASLSGVTATLPIASLSVGNHSLMALYDGDLTHGGATSPVIAQEVDRAATSLALVASPNPAPYLGPVTFTATASAVAPGAGTPTSTVDFRVDGVSVGASDLVGGSATVNQPFDLSIGAHSVQAVYSGDGNFLGSSSTISLAVESSAPEIVFIRDVPNDQGGKVAVAWHCVLDQPGIRRVTGYRIWRRLSGTIRGAAAQGQQPLSILGRGAQGSGRAWTRRVVQPDSAVGETFWEAIAELPSAQLVSYGYTASTTQDSLPGSNPYTAFFVEALTADPFVFLDSAPDSGYSVDNLSPPTPTPFTAVYAPLATALHWGVSTAPDFGEFRLYRGIQSDFVPGPSNLVIASQDTGYVDQASTPYVYKLSAVDIHGNESHFAVVTPNGPVATLASLVTIDARPDRIQLTWFSANPGLIATVYRRTASSDWASLGQITVDGTGYLRYEDTAVQTGTRYGYRLGIMDAGVEVFVGEAWATPEPLVLTLDGARPNPAVGGALTVAFTLPSAEAAKLELIDVSGRRLAARDVGSLGPGAHSVDLGEGTRIPPGIYLLRLSEAGERLTRRVAMLP
jgi:hypothetical protein